LAAAANATAESATADTSTDDTDDGGDDDYYDYSYEDPDLSLDTSAEDMSNVDFAAGAESKTLTIEE